MNENNIINNSLNVNFDDFAQFHVDSTYERNNREITHIDNNYEIEKNDEFDYKFNIIVKLLTIQSLNIIH